MGNQITPAKQSSDNLSPYKEITPEDKSLSSGFSYTKGFINGIMRKIDNVKNVSNYLYKGKGFLKENQGILKLKDLRFSFWEEISVAGMPDFSSDYEQYPQGICITKDYVLISSYSEKKNVLGKLSVYDKLTGELLITLGLDGDSHMGGVTCDGENVWICNSSKMTLEAISYRRIQMFIEAYKGKLVDVTNIIKSYPVKNIPSCVTYYKGSLWVATHNKQSASKMIEYVYDGTKDSLVGKERYHIPPRVQGITFTEGGGVFLSTSYGRKNSSYVKEYLSVNEMSQNVENPLRTIELPPCSEELVYDKNKLYILFESAGRKFLEGTDGYGKSLSPLDKILIIDLT